MWFTQSTPLTIRGPQGGRKNGNIGLYVGSAQTFCVTPWMKTCPFSSGCCKWISLQGHMSIPLLWAFTGITVAVFICLFVWGFPGSSVVESPLPKQETQVRSSDWEDPLEKEMATQSSILAWEILGTEEPGGLQSPWEHKRVRYNLATEQKQQQCMYLFSSPRGFHCCAQAFSSLGSEGCSLVVVHRLLRPWLPSLGLTGSRVQFQQ